MTWRTAYMPAACCTHPVCVEGPAEVELQQLHALAVIHGHECQVCNALLNVCKPIATAAALSNIVSINSFSNALSSILTQSEGTDMQQ